ncbi:MAG: hypothetical protein E4G98_00390 [Promethearchaeota archaeon]|nr:MAG: hypothetical protein E4G98_00390 [Candidatus Lokiarchaeota archaeon]
MSTELQRQRNRLRLMALFIIYPIYKCIASILDQNWATAIVMGFLSLLLLGVLIYFYIRKNPNRTF